VMSLTPRVSNLWRSSATASALYIWTLRSKPTGTML
jgi:hypothetical protein